ncbi:hypothetical protein ACOSQ3_004491 [Xanthoceras sorbifolium]
MTFLVPRNKVNKPFFFIPSGSDTTIESLLIYYPTRKNNRIVISVRVTTIPSANNQSEESEASETANISKKQEKLGTADSSKLPCNSVTPKIQCSLAHYCHYGAPAQSREPP